MDLLQTSSAVRLVPHVGFGAVVWHHSHGRGDGSIWAGWGCRPKAWSAKETPRHAPPPQPRPPPALASPPSASLLITTIIILHILSATRHFDVLS